MYQRIIKVFNRLNYNHEIIYIDNDSTDKSVDIFTKLASKDNNVKVIFMSRNFGSPQPSFLAGLEYTKADASILLQGDIQDPPELIPKFIQKWEKGYDVVYGIKTYRKGYGFFMNFLYKFFYFLLQKFAYIKIPLNAGEFSLIDRRVIDELLKIEEYDYHIRCLRAFVGFKQIGIEYTREARKHGKSTENFFSYISFAKNVIINFSFKPLEWISKIAFLIMFFSFAILIVELILYLVYKNAPPGISTIILLILFLGGVQLFCISIIAEYIAKIFLEVKKRPKYIIKKILNGNMIQI